MWGHRRGYLTSGVIGAALLLGAGCASQSDGLPAALEDDASSGGPDAGAQPPEIDARVTGAPDSPADGPTASIDAAPGRTGAGHCETPPATKKPAGRTCTCTEECGSGFCIDGVCCSTACEGTCMACNIATNLGKCSPVPAGGKPVLAGQCPTDPASMCSAGHDGTCDGSGKCRTYQDNTMCTAPTKCNGSTVSGSMLCSGTKCSKPGPTIQCAPYNCDVATNKCLASCKVNADCIAGQPCVSGKCTGKKPLGSSCGSKTDCGSGFCADGVCCNLACTGSCVSCNLEGKMGECTQIAANLPDPHDICKSQGITTCGLTGLCNGRGGCAKYAAGTVCGDASCSGNNFVPTSTCNGSGTCVPGSPVGCAPFVCAGKACKSMCESNADCSSPNICGAAGAGSCGKKGQGQTCASAGECKSGSCVDGVCCDSACTGTCEYCALANALGRCSSVPPGAIDPRGKCIDKGPASCGFTGRCSGNRSCEMYLTGTECQAESCDPNTNRHLRAGSCANGACVVPPAETCAPFLCSGSRCATSCGATNQCMEPNTCQMGSCGRKPIGAVCGMAVECVTGFCAQGVCCSSACTASCFSCALPSSTGTCVALPAGSVDPACQDQGPTSCGNDGTCNGSGSCRKYASGTICAQPSCTTGVSTTASSCNGVGNCITGSTQACGTFVCNIAGTGCNSTCVDNTQCSAGNRCLNGLCGKKGNGAACNDPGECQSNFCADGVCCNTGCSGICKTCALAAALGTCTNVPIGVSDPGGRCPISNESTCGTDGTCNGAGACRQWPRSTPCQAATCPINSSTGTTAAICDGSGTCLPPATTSCGTFKCDAVAKICKTNCATKADCSGDNLCIAGSCGKNLLGAKCSQDTECLQGHCVDGTCCSTSSCGTCQTCSNASGVCGAVHDGDSDPDSCSDQTASNPCGTTGVCNGAGRCRLASSGTACGKTCSGDSSSVITKTCNGLGTCNGTGGTTSCGGYKCVTGACAATCDPVNGPGCIEPKVCIENACVTPPPPPPDLPPEPPVDAGSPDGPVLAPDLAPDLEPDLQPDAADDPLPSE